MTDLAPSLLPGNATPLEHELARAAAPLDALDPIVIETMWDAWTIPARYLDRLAWALSVDLWDPGWGEIRKRQAVADSPAYHRIKGTRHAVEIALALLEQPYELIEWYELRPRDRRGTARLRIAVTDLQPATLQYLQKTARRLLRASKPKSRAVSIGVGLALPGAFRIACITAIHTTTIVGAYAPVYPPSFGPAPVTVASRIHHQGVVTDARI